MGVEIREVFGGGVQVEDWGGGMGGGAMDVLYEHCQVVMGLVLYIHTCIHAYLHPFPLLSIGNFCYFKRAGGGHGHPY